ncbi:RagB/SusD family nutrient uptake outer membrane protein [Rhodohalobacter barkolensis]|uniref:RagB/SusD family nutrient uptake outer membrane protein n=1 Tax=Rhodohalobacter barkolensis TaxID=2053187 RepID=UPI0013FD3CF5|nr:RagB/SusD family nutrient uptake outer membrane protein [Rhodohalobacter barkolensis]
MILFQGCDGLLDVDPQQSVDSEDAITTAEDVNSVLVGAYDALGDGDLYGGWIQMTGDLLASEGNMSFIGTFFGPREIANKNQLYDNGQLTSTWVDAYNTINITNNVLANLELLDEFDAPRVEGEAKLIRGLMYFELVRLFAATYEAGQVNDQAGVPIILEPTGLITDEDNTPRSSVEDVYTLILNDLNDAKNLLSISNPEESYYGNSLVASAVLSRVYLQQGEYEDARDEANRVIEEGNYSLARSSEIGGSDFAAAFNNESNTPEDIFAMQNTNQDGTNSFITFYAEDSRGDIVISEGHLDEYEANDDRLNLFYSVGSDVFTGKWDEEPDSEINSANNVNLIRLAEMYLTRAEGNFRLGEDVGDTPLNDINIIRDRVNLDPLLIGELDLDAILLERKFELMFEGNLLHDLKRTQRDVGSRTYDDPKLVLPIPRRDIDVNSNLCQNPTYTGPQC